MPIPFFKPFSRQLLRFITYLLAVFWLYAAISKALDYRLFRLQLGRSPLLVGYESLIAIGVPLTELLTAALLIKQKTRLVGLYTSLSLLFLFTSYLVIVVNYSYWRPCTCTGILPYHSWGDHIIFNAGLIIIVIIEMLMTGYEQSALKLT